MSQIENHRLSSARYVHSPNQNVRPHGEISLIVIHGISLPPGQFGGSEIIDLFTSTLNATGEMADLEGVQVSSHLLIRRDGELLQFVSFDQRAWHAGRSRFGDRENCNDFAIGIELEGTDQQPYSEAQYTALVVTCARLMQAYSITQIVGHEHVSPGRKTDPGPAFDWQRLQSGLARVLAPPT